MNMVIGSENSCTSFCSLALKLSACALQCEDILACCGRVVSACSRHRPVYTLSSHRLVAASTLCLARPGTLFHESLSKTSRA